MNAEGKLPSPSDRSLDPSEQAALREHLERLQSREALCAAIREAGGVTHTLNWRTVKRAMDGSGNSAATTIADIRRFLSSRSSKLAAYRRKQDEDGLMRHHAQRYTGVLLHGVQPKPEANASLDFLYDDHVPVSAYKRGLMRAIRHANDHPDESPLPPRVAFIAHTGQWLKPVVRSLIKHKHPLRIDIYLSDPQRPSMLPGPEPGGAEVPEAAEVLGTMEFLWSLPATLDLGKNKSCASLNVYCFQGAPCGEALPQRMTLFEGDVACKTEERSTDRASDLFQGHPGNVPAARRFTCPAGIEIALRGHDRFDELVNEFDALTGDDGASLPGLLPDPLLSWDAERGFGGRACHSKDTRVFDIDPMNMFWGTAGGFIEDKQPTDAPGSTS